MANILGIEEGYLVLIWVMTFMNYFFISMTAVTLVRITKNKNLNNILTAFFLTFVLSVFRAPFNALHLVTMILSVYCFTYMFDLFKEEKTSLYLLLNNKGLSHDKPLSYKKFQYFTISSKLF